MNQSLVLLPNYIYVTVRRLELTVRLLYPWILTSTFVVKDTLSHINKIKVNSGSEITVFVTLGLYSLEIVMSMADKIMQSIVNQSAQGKQPRYTISGHFGPKQFPP